MNKNNDVPKLEKDSAKTTPDLGELLEQARKLALDRGFHEDGAIWLGVRLGDNAGLCGVGNSGRVGPDRIACKITSSPSFAVQTLIQELEKND